MNLLHSTRIRRALLGCLAAAALVHLAGVTPSLAQEAQYKAGDRVEADVNMSSSPEYQNWRPATVVEVMMWQGQVSGIHLKTDDGLETTTSARFMRPAPAAGTAAAATAGDQETAYAVGDRVEVDVNMSSDPEDQKWQTATITKVELWQGQVAGYFIETDAGRELVTNATSMRPSTAPPPQVAAQGGGNEGEAPGGGSQSAKAGAVPRGTPLPAPPSSSGGGALSTGNYTCWAANGTAGVLRLVIKGGGQYTNEQGTTGRYDYDAASGQITFRTGPWEGFYGTNLGPRKIGLSSRPGGSPNTLCDIK